MNNGIWNKRVADLQLEKPPSYIWRLRLSKLWLGSFQKVLLSNA